MYAIRSLCTIGFLAFAFEAQATPSPVYSGRLTLAATTTPVPDGTYEMVFTVFDAEDATLNNGTKVFEQSFLGPDAVPVTSGYFQVLLDNNEVEVGADLSDIFVQAQHTLFLQVTIEGEVTASPSILGIAPAALRAVPSKKVKTISYGGVDFHPGHGGAQDFKYGFGGDTYSHGSTHARHPLYAPLHTIPDGAILKTLRCYVVDDDDSNDDDPIGGSTVRVSINNHMGNLIGDWGNSVGKSPDAQEVVVDLNDFVLKRDTTAYHIMVQWASAPNRFLRRCEVDYVEGL